MPLETQEVQVDFTQGQETFLDERLVAKGKLIALQNASLAKNGSIKRRDGYAQYATSALSPNNVYGVAQLGNEILGTNGQQLFSVVDSSGTSGPPKGTLYSFSVSKMSISHSTTNQWTPDMAVSSTLVAYTWMIAIAGVNSGIGVMLVEGATGNIVLAPTTITSNVNARCPRVVRTATADQFIVFFAQGGAGAGSIAGAVVTTSGVGAITTVSASLVQDQAAGTGLGVMDVIYEATDQRWMLVYISSAATGVTALAGNVAAGVPNVTQGPTSIISAATAPTPSNVCIVQIDPTNYLVGAYGANALGELWTRIISQFTATLTAATKQDNRGSDIRGALVGILNGSSIQLFYDYYPLGGVGATFANGTLKTVSVNSSNAIVAGPSTFANSSIVHGVGGVFGPCISGKPFIASAPQGVTLPVAMQEDPGTGAGGLQNSWFLLNSVGVVVAKALYGAADFILPSFSVGGVPSMPSVFIVPGSTSYSATMTERSQFGFSNSQATWHTGLCALSLAPQGLLPPIKSLLGGALYFDSGGLSRYDGLGCVEAGFHTYPESVSVVDGAAGSIPAGAYQYVAVYEWIDNLGNREQSTPSVAFNYTAPGAKRATVTYPNLMLTQKANVNIVIYRTQKNGTTFYRLNDVNSPLVNTTGAAEGTYTDNATDAAISSNEILYTVGGALGNNGPPPSTAMVAHQNRLWFNVSDDANSFRYSQQLVNQVVPQFNETLAGRLPPESGGVVGFASMDDKLIVFGKRKIYAVYGQGPDQGGNNGTYTLPQEIPSDVGCSDARSILPMPMGVMFQTSKGFHLLGRDLSVRYVGSGVESFNGTAVYSATMLHDKRQCRFGLAPNGVAACLVYDYMQDQWGTFANVTGMDVNDAIWSETKGSFVFADTNVIQRETIGTHSDNGQVIPISLTTSWLRLDTFLGFERVEWLVLGGAFGSPSTLQVSVGYDYDSAFTTPAPAVSGTSTPSGNAWLQRFKMRQQKCTAIRFQITETPATANAGLSFSSMVLVIGVKKGIAKLPAAQTA